MEIFSCQFLTLFVLTSLSLIHLVNCANILFFWGFSGASHRITGWPLVQKLADKGHNVTFLSPHHPKKVTIHPNITDMVWEELYVKGGMDYDPAEIRINGGVKAVEALWSQYVESGVQICRVLTQNKEILAWADSAKYDLVVVNGLFNDCGYGFAWKFNAPTIIYGTSSLFQWWGEVYGIPDENHPEFHYHLTSNMTFAEEVWNTFTPLYWHFYRQWIYLPKLEAMLRPALNIPDMPSLFELDQRNNLVLTNTHFSEEFARSLPPLVVPVGGQHITEKSNPLPEKIQKFIDKWDNGVIYFSFGTYMRLPLLPQRLKDAIFGAIRKFPSIGFIMKWNGGPVPDNLPENILTSEWLAQQDILAHPKIRAFISHGGLLSTQEAVYHGVPIIVFPIFAEQDYNAVRIHSNERGLMMEISELTEDKLENAIREVLTNKKYKENMAKVSRIFRDRPERPVDTAAWWVEYVLRHKNTSFLKPVGATRTWYQRRMLHIWAFVAVAVGSLLLVSSLLLYKVVSGVLEMLVVGVSGKQKMKVL